MKYDLLIKGGKAVMPFHDARLSGKERAVVDAAATSVLSGRLLSLDVFRGLTIAAMVLVNNAGDWNHVYWPLGHAPWHGWTPTDLIFP